MHWRGNLHRTVTIVYTVEFRFFCFVPNMSVDIYSKLSAVHISTKNWTYARSCTVCSVAHWATNAPVHWRHTLRYCTTTWEGCLCLFVFVLLASIVQNSWYLMMLSFIEFLVFIHWSYVFVSRYLQRIKYMLKKACTCTFYPAFKHFIVPIQMCKYRKVVFI